MRAELATTQDELRNLAHGIRPPALESGGLGAADGRGCANRNGSGLGGLADRVEALAAGSRSVTGAREALS